ncbi:hypothetical protein [Dactylosporangium sp. NPDC050588]|uniref:hypothetical protein n=1 Tax=Dactylosporangium sp. NPDC050588 TaxID=3157211 RepID=UPI0033CDEF34
MSTVISPFTGNCPKNVSKDAKYAIRTSPRGPVVALTYQHPNGERWLATTADHPDLVHMVNRVKVEMGYAPNGPFYINEHSQVIVPVAIGGDTTYYLADEYDLALEFEFEGNILSGNALDDNGDALEPGDPWTGPHPGIPYVLKSGKAEIYYMATPRPNVERPELLSSHVGKDLTRVIAERVRRVKGWDGGRFYVNEWREMFAPVNGGTGWEYIYIGHLAENDPWFPKPIC